MRAGALVAAAIAVAALATRADAAPTPRVAILVGETLGVDVPEADALGAALATRLGEKLVVEAIGGADVARRLPPAGLPDECLSTPACLADLGTRLGADHLLVLAIVKAGDGVQIDANLIDLATGASTPRPRLQVADLAAADAAFAEAATRYLPDAAERTAIVIGGSGERHRPIAPAVWAAGGVGAAALIGSSILGLTLKAKYDQCNDTGHPCDDATKDAIRTRALVADVTLGVGVAAAAVAIVLYVRTPTETRGVAPAVAPVSGGAVVGVGGRF